MFDQEGFSYIHANQLKRFMQTALGDVEDDKCEHVERGRDSYTHPLPLAVSHGSAWVSSGGKGCNAMCLCSPAVDQLISEACEPDGDGLIDYTGG